MTAETTNIKVAVRVRPYNRKELEQNQRCIIKVLDGTTLLFDPEEEDDEFFFQGTKQYRDITKRVNKKISMEFDRVFDTETTNNQIFEECTAPLVNSVLDGYNCSVFVYGATGAGKTFTMLGNAVCPGLTFLTMRDLFNKIEQQSDVCKFDVGVSYLEVYNEQVMNLLTKSGPLKLREDSNGVVVSGLVLKPIYSAEGLLELLALGNLNRTQHPTDANAESSRSHAIFQVHIRMCDRKTSTKRTVKLSMIDLAGSERAASTKGIGVRFKEGASINKSLLALGNCINKLADGLKHIPYRDSNLTRILKDSLGGNCRTLMVANVSMSSLTYEDTYNTLKYASRAKKIRTVLRQNAMKSNMPKDFYVKKVNELMDENNRLKESIKALEAKLAASEKAKSVPKLNAFNESELKQWCDKLDAAYLRVGKIQEYTLCTQSKINKLTFLIKLKEDAMRYRQILKLDRNNSKEEFGNFTSSISLSNLEITKYKEEIMSWRKKLQDACKDLDKLKKESKNCNYNETLEVYKTKKDLEIRTSKQDITINHITGINSDCIINSHKLRQVLVSACEVLQKSYSLISVHHKLGGELEENFNQLQRQMSSYCDIIVGGSYRKQDDNEKDKIQLLLNGKRLHQQDDVTSFSVMPKRPYNNLETVNDNYIDLRVDTEIENIDAMSYGAACSLNAEKSLNLDETQLLSAMTNDFCNATFIPSQDVKSVKNIANNEYLVNNILSEQIVHAPNNKEKLRSILIKSKNFNQGLLKTVAVVNAQKESNKRSPLKVRKSPRPLPQKIGINSIKKVTTTATNKRNAEAPTVRINRAASFRVKK